MREKYKYIPMARMAILAFEGAKSISRLRDYGILCPMYHSS